MRFIIILLVALLTLGGGGAGAYFYFLSPNSAEAKVTDDIDVKELGSEEHQGMKILYEYVEIEPVMLPIVDANGVNQVISMVVAIEAMSGGNAEKVRELQPRFKSALITDMYGVLNKHAQRKGGVLKVNYIKKRLYKIANEIMGEDVVEDVKLQLVQQRPV